MDLLERPEQQHSAPTLGAKCSGPWQVQLLVADPPAGTMSALTLEALPTGFCMYSRADSQLIGTLNGPWTGDSGKLWHFLTCAVLVTTERQKWRRMREKESGQNKADLVVWPRGGRRTVRATPSPCFPTTSVGTSLTVLSSEDLPP